MGEAGEPADLDQKRTGVANQMEKDARQAPDQGGDYVYSMNADLVVVLFAWSHLVTSREISRIGGAPAINKLTV